MPPRGNRGNQGSNKSNNDPPPDICESTGSPPPEGGRCPTALELINKAKGDIEDKAMNEATFWAAIIVGIILLLAVLVVYLVRREFMAYRKKADALAEATHKKVMDHTERLVELEGSG
jgi:hypothetical protein